MSANAQKIFEKDATKALQYGITEGYPPLRKLLEDRLAARFGCDKEGNTYNINGDTAAAHIAGALNAERLIMMTDIAGVLRDREDPDSLIPELTVSDCYKLRDEGIISGGMIPKIDCCIEAIRRGVQNVIIMDGRIPHSILIELLSDRGIGTMMIREEEK